MFEQLRPGEVLEVLAEPAAWLDDVRAAFEQAHGEEADWQRSPGRIGSTSGSPAPSAPSLPPYPSPPPALRAL